MISIRGCPKQTPPSGGVLGVASAAAPIGSGVVAAALPLPRPAPGAGVPSATPVVLSSASVALRLGAVALGFACDLKSLGRHASA